MKKLPLIILALLLSLVCVSALACSDNGSEKGNDETDAENTLPEKFDSTTYIKNKELWDGKDLTDDGLYNFIVEYKSEKIEAGGFGVSYNKFGGDFLHDTLSTPGEWGNALLTLRGISDGAGRVSTYDFYADGGPTTREQALERVLEFLSNYKKEENPFPFYSEMQSWYPWHHYAGMAGYDNLGVEIGENLCNYQFEIATLRGAAKQYNASWFVDFSAWNYYSMTSYGDTYTDDNGVTYSPLGGHSINLTERSLMMSFMMGADATIVEGGEHRLDYPGTEDITPLGEMCQRLYQFTTEYNDIGTAYSPFAIMLDVYHGMNELYGGKIFKVFHQEYYDKFTGDIIQDFIWPDYYSVMYHEKNKIINGEYGDSFDSLLYGASEELLSTYKALIFTGNFNPSDAELEIYKNYVNNGGVIVLNTAYTSAFSSFVELPSKLDGGYFKEIPYGSGSFFIFGEGGGKSYDIMNFEDRYTVYCGDYETGGFDFIMKELCKRYIPFEFSENIQHIISIKDDCIYLYLCNNLGIDKLTVGEVMIDESKTIDLTCNFTAGYAIDGLEDIYNQHEVSQNGTEFSLTLTPGDIAIIKIDIGGRL